VKSLRYLLIDHVKLKAIARQFEHPKQFCDDIALRVNKNMTTVLKSNQFSVLDLFEMKEYFLNSDKQWNEKSLS
jgi:hypothetical protein